MPEGTLLFRLRFTVISMRKFKSYFPDNRNRGLYLGTNLTQDKVERARKAALYRQTVHVALVPPASASAAKPARGVVHLYRHRRSPNKPKAWFERDEGALLRAEQALVEREYPDLAFQIDAGSGRMQLVGIITLLSECGVSTPIAVRIEFRPDYPNSEPDAYDDAKRFPEDIDRHILKGGRFCLWLPPSSQWNPEDPERLLRFLAEVAVFLDRQLVYDATGGCEWPGPQQKHGRAGYEEFMLTLLEENQATSRRCSRLY